MNPDGERDWEWCRKKLAPFRRMEKGKKVNEAQLAAQRATLKKEEKQREA